MKSLSIRVRITLWIAAAMLVVVALTFAIIMSISNSVMQKTIRDQLIATVEDNVDEVEYYATDSELDRDNDADQYISYGEGFLEIDDDYLDSVNGVMTALYHENGTLVYGETPIRLTLDCADGIVRKVKSEGQTWYVFDRQLDRGMLKGLWLRGVVSENQGRAQLSAIAKLSLLLLPLLAVLGILGGYVIAGRMLAPVGRISDAAEKIGDGGDLKQRIAIGPGNDELHRLANAFDGMFSRLDAAFAAERQFASDASHELRTPMAVILAQCEYALEAPRATEEYADALQVIQRQGERMSRLIEQMLEFTRLESGTVQYERVPVDMTELVESLCADLALLKEREITLTWQAQPGVIVVGNRTLLQRLLANLVSNAYRYGKDGGHTQVVLCTEGNDMQLSVSDDGIGISPEQQERIFARFYQAERARGTRGMGLGLAMAREIAKFHGGELSVLSQTGQGSTFTFRMRLDKRKGIR